MFHLPVRQSAVTGLCALIILAVAAPAAAQSGSAAPAASQPTTRAAVSAQLDANFKAIDTNGDKSLSAAEIAAAQAKSVAQAKAAIAKRMETEFARMDSNKDGQISLTELKAMAPTPQAPPASELLGQIDRNKDGKLNLEGIARTRWRTSIGSTPTRTARSAPNRAPPASLAEPSVSNHHKGEWM